MSRKTDNNKAHVPPKPRVGLSNTERQLVFDLRLALHEAGERKAKGLRNLRYRVLAADEYEQFEPSRYRAAGIERLERRLETLSQVYRRMGRAEGGHTGDRPLTDEALVEFPRGISAFVEAVVALEDNLGRYCRVAEGGRGVRWATQGQLDARERWESKHG